MAPQIVSILYSRRRASVRVGALLLLIGAVAAGVVGLIRWSGAASAVSLTPAPPQILMQAELRSWIVAGRGRHLYLSILAPDEFPELTPRIEYTAAYLRADYDPATDPTQSARLCRMTPGRPLRPPGFSGPPDNRLEATYTITLEQARILQRDRVFTEPYVLLGTNSTTGLRRAMEDAKLQLPSQVLAGYGIFGEFPGVDRSPGAELSPDQWRRYGFTPPLSRN